MRKMFVVLLVAMCMGLAAGDSLPTLIKRFERGDWGYQELNVALNSRYHRSNSNSNYPYLDTENPNDDGFEAERNINRSSRYEYQFGTQYYRQQESENICYRYSLGPSFEWSRRTSESWQYVNDEGNTKKTSDTKDRTYYIGARQDFDSEIYFDDIHFFAVGADAYGSINNQRYEFEDGDTQESERKRLEVDLELGAGRGRLRDVTNVVRAKWMADRLADRHDIELSDEQILLLAQYLDKQTAYTNVFDWYGNASEATFWRDVMNDLGLQLTYDQFLDMTREARSGTMLHRKQGYNYKLGVLGEYELYGNETSRTSNSVSPFYARTSDETEATAYGLYADAGYWFNFSVRDQLGVTLPVRYSLGKSDETIERTEVETEKETTDFTLFSVVPEASYLYQLTDRIGCEVSASAGYYLFGKDIDYSYMLYDVDARVTSYLSASIWLVLDASYIRGDYFDDDAIENGGNQFETWDFTLKLQWRPIASML